MAKLSKSYNNGRIDGNGKFRFQLGRKDIQVPKRLRATK